MKALREMIQKLENKTALSPQEMTAVMESIMSGQADEAFVERFLVLLRDKKETAEELAAAASVLRRHSLKLSRAYPDLLDTCGTGGDAKQTLNISTLTAIVAASAGVQVGKHGNRSVSSQCGSADLLEALGVKIDLPLAAIESGLEKTGFGFFFAPRFHPAMRHAMPVRRRIKGKTIFNCLGPLSNPAGSLHQLIGVYEERLVPIMARVLLDLGARRALVVHGRDGLDEISLGSGTVVSEVREGKIESYEIEPESYGLRRMNLRMLRCATRDECRDAALAVLEGEEGPRKDVVCLNAGAAFYVAGKAASIEDGVALAREMIEDGLAKEKLDEIAAFSQNAGAVPDSV